MEEIKKIQSREDIPEQDKWRLEDIYPSDEAWEEDRRSLARTQEAVAAFAGTLGASADKLYAFLSLMEHTSVIMERLANYSMRRLDEDTRSAYYQAMHGRFVSTAVALNSACSFADPEILAISDADLEAFYSRKPELTRYRRYLTALRRQRAHTLSATEEKLLAAAGEFASAPNEVYSSFKDADLQYPDAVDAQGNRHPVTQGNFVKLSESTDRTLRKSAYESVYDTITSFRNTLAATLNAQNQKLKFFAEVRNYPGALEAALFQTEVPTAVYDNLIESVHRNLDKMHRYVRLRKKLLGVDTLHFWDMYTPLVPGVDRYIPYAQAKQTVYEALHPLGETYRKILKEGLEDRWIDVYETPGKRSGAYCAGSRVHPYVLLNYSGTLSSQFTLAHEMGHALHSYLSDAHQSPFDSRYVIFVAEVASTCNEALLMEYLLGKTQDRKERAYLINHFLDQFRGTIYRQTLFAEFERSIGRLTAQGQKLTADVLCGEYRRLNELYYGPDIVVDDRIAMEWARIPHFYYNYYVFQYATGFAAAIALSRRILNEGAPAVDDYLGFLSGGCSQSPIDLLKGAGVDMTSAQPIDDALKLFDSLLDEMEALMEA